MTPARPSCTCGDCRTCQVRANQARYREKNRERLRQEHAAWLRTPEGLAYQAKRRRQEPEKIRARAAVGRAVRSGRLERGDCALAHLGGCKGRIEGHHRDYSKPLEVTWVCQAHHPLLDAQEEADAA